MFENEEVIDPGQLRHRVAVQRQSTIPGPTGQPISTWNTLGTFSAFVKPLSGRELVLAQQVDETISHEITMRNVGLITSKDRFVWKNVTLNINSIVEVNGTDEAYKILATAQP